MSNLEKQVREIDIIDKPIKEIALAAANIFNLSFEYCKKILQIKRAGFDSDYEYLKYLAKKRKFGLNKTDPRYAYTACLSIVKRGSPGKNKHKRNHRFEKRRRFEKSIRALPPAQIYSISPYYEEPKSLEKEELAQKLQNLISYLPKREAEVIRDRYYLNQELKEIAKRFKVSYQMIEQMEQRALKTLYFKAKEHNLQEYIE